MGEREVKVSEVLYSVDGINFKEIVNFENLRVYGSLSDDNVWIPKCNGNFSFKCNGNFSFKIKERHRSRKWKKKHGMLRRQAKRKYKEFKKIFHTKLSVNQFMKTYKYYMYHPIYPHIYPRLENLTQS